MREVETKRMEFPRSRAEFRRPRTYGTTKLIHESQQAERDLRFGESSAFVALTSGRLPGIDNSARRIETARESPFGSTDFSLCAFLGAQSKSKPHRLKPVLLDCRRIGVRNAHKSRVFAAF